MFKIFPAQYSFTPVLEAEYLDWMFPRNKRLINCAVIIILAFIVFITGADFLSEDRTFGLFSVITLLRIIMFSLVLIVLYAFNHKEPIRAQYILFLDIFLIVIIYTIDNYISFRDINNILSPGVQMFSLYLFMLIPFLSFVQKVIIGGVFVCGLGVCTLNLQLVNSTETMYFVSFLFIAEMLVCYRLELLFRGKFKALVDDKKHTYELKISKQELEVALIAEREVIKQNLNFIDMISHEYRTPLSIISTSIDSLETKPIASDPKKVSHYVGVIRRASERLLSIYESSLHEKRINLSGIMPYKKSVEILSVVEVAVEFTRSIYPAHQVLIRDIIRPDSTVFADNELLTTAIINVIENACKYSSPSRVEVSIEKVESRCVIKITDKGIGIDSSELEVVFEKYYRSGLTKQKPGAGVGLYLVKKIIELHSGSVEIISRRKEGTTVVISIPFSEGE